MVEEVHPFALRDAQRCPDCGQPTAQQYIPVSHRGNFKHGGSKLMVRPVGQICKCKEKHAHQD